MSNPSNSLLRQHYWFFDTFIIGLMPTVLVTVSLTYFLILSVFAG
jgi:hypothetical protein